jgi:hypothetical protein
MTIKKNHKVFHLLIRDHNNPNKLTTRTVRLHQEREELAKNKGIRLFNGYFYALSMAKSYDLEGEIVPGRFIKYKIICEGEIFIPYKRTVKRK